MKQITELPECTWFVAYPPPVSSLCSLQVSELCCNMGTSQDWAETSFVRVHKSDLLEQQMQLFSASGWFLNPLKDSLSKISFVTLGIALGQVASASVTSSMSCFSLRNSLCCCEKPPQKQPSCRVCRKSQVTTSLVGQTSEYIQEVVCFQVLGGLGMGGTEMLSALPSSYVHKSVWKSKQGWQCGARDEWYNMGKV